MESTLLAYWVYYWKQSAKGLIVAVKPLMDQLINQVEFWVSRQVYETVRLLMKADYTILNAEPPISKGDSQYMTINEFHFHVDEYFQNLVNFRIISSPFERPYYL